MGSSAGTSRANASRTVSWPALIGVCVLAAAVRIGWDVSVHAVPVSDFGWYYEHAIGIVTGHGFSTNGLPTAFWPPGYPLFLAGVFRVLGTSLFAAKASNVALWTLSVALTYLLGLRLGGRWTALIAGLIVALFPEFILFANLTASENLFVPLLLGALLAISPAQDMKRPPSSQRAAVAGLLIGCSVVVRPTSVLLPFLIVAVLIAWYRSKQVMLASLALLLAFALPVGALLVRNDIAMGSPMISSSGGFSLWLGLNPKASGTYRLKGAPLPTDDLSTPAKEVAYNSKYTREAVAFVTQHPWRVLGLVHPKYHYLFDKPSTLGWNTAGTVRSAGGSWQERTFTPLEKRLIGLVVAMRVNTPVWMKWLYYIGVLGIAIALVQRRTVGVWLGVLVVYWLLFHLTLANGQPRFLIPVAPAFALGTAYLGVWAAGFVNRAVKAR